jgi:uncharacterized protein (TIGR02099 family)
MHRTMRKSRQIAGWLRHRAQAARRTLHAWRSRLPAPVKRALRRVTHWTLHSALGVLLALVAVFGLAHLWLPTLAERQGEIEAYVSSAIGNPVTFERLETFWDGLNPGVHVHGLRVHAAAGRAPLAQLREIRLSLAWLPLITGRIEIGSLVLVEPHLALERQVDGRLRITGIEVPGAEEAAGQQDFTRWLLRQREMTIENGELEWLDRLPAAGATTPERLSIRRVHLSLRNDGERHRLDLRAAFPRALCADCRVALDVRGNPLLDADWRGAIDLQARDLALAALPRILRDRLPKGLDGHFDLRLQSRWREARVQALEGRAAVTDLRLPLPGEPQPLRLRRMETTLAWQGDAAAWRLELARLQLGLTRAPWSAGQLRLEVEPERLQLGLDHLDLGDLATFAAGLPRDSEFLTWLRAARPEGGLDRLDLELRGDPTAPEDFRVRAGLRALRMAAVERLPGVRGLSGQLALTPDSGEFRLDSGAGQVLLPRLFREPLEFTRAASRIRWRQNPEDWFVRAEDVTLQGRDLRTEGELELRLPKDPQVSPVLKLDMQAHDGVAAHTARYLPLALPEALRGYLERAIVSGRMTEGRVQFHGALRNFPFRDGKGKFEVRAHVENGVYAYLPDWEPIREASADLRFTGTDMLITATRGQVRGLRLGRVTVAIEDFKAPDGAVVTVSGRAAGSLNATLAVLADSRSPRFAAWLLPGLQATGDGVLALELRIPTHRPPDTTLAGDYRFLGSSLEVPFRSIRADALHGALGFSEAGLQSGRLSARLLGGEAALEVTPEPDGGARLAARGTIAHSGLVQAFGSGMASRLSGEVPWQGQVRLRRDGNDWSLESDLRDLELRLPAPLAKARGEPLTLALRTVPGSNADGPVVALQAAERVAGRLAFRRAEGGWTLTRGRIGIGEPVSQLPAQDGLQLGVRLPALNADHWWSLLRPGIGDGADHGWLDLINHVSAEVEALEVFGRPFGRLSVDLGKWPGSWHGRLEGEAVAGQVVLAGSPAAAAPAPGAPTRPGVYLTLERLTLPPARPGGDELDVDPRTLPVVAIKSGTFSAAGIALGALEFNAEPVHQGWRIAALKLNQPASALSATGLWEVDRQGQQSTRLEATLVSSDFSQLLDSFGYSGEMVGGKLNIDSRWSWPGAPGAFRLARLDGDLTLSLTEGRLPKISPGAGRLLGTLDLRALTRYLSFDFSNVFGKGLAFDNIKGRLEVEDGNAYTRDLTIHSPGADIELNGRIGLATRDLDLEMGVTPRVMSELAITGGLLGGPAVGAAVAVIHTLIKKPFEKSTRINYTVKGAWSDPAATRLGGPALPAEAEQN